MYFCLRFFFFFIDGKENVLSTTGGLLVLPQYNPRQFMSVFEQI